MPADRFISFSRSNLLHQMLLMFFFTIFSAAREDSIMTEAEPPSRQTSFNPSPQSQCPSQGLTWLLEGWLCFLCVARPRYHITAHMLMQQQNLPTPLLLPRLLSAQPHRQWSEANQDFNLSTATLQSPIREISPHFCYRHF